MHISKSLFLAARTCPTQGWYAARQPAQPSTPALEWRRWTGQEIGRIAQEELGRGIVIGPGSIETTTARTVAALAERTTEVVYEAAFQHGPFVARADAVRRHGAGWDLLEVKSGKAPEIAEDGSFEVKQDYLDDLAYTLFVARGAGLPLARCFLVLLRPDIVLGDEQPLLVLLDVTESVVPIADQYVLEADAIAAAVLAQDRPEPELIFECRDCPFFESDCLGREITDPLWIIPRLQKPKFEALKPYRRIRGIPPEAKLTELQDRVVRAVQSDQAWVSVDGLAALERLAWPAYFLDFEAVQPALPWFEGTGPYETLPFQYSIHVVEAPEAEPRHLEYLAAPGADWRRDLVERLLESLGRNGSIVVYSSYENTTMRRMAEVFPDLAPRLDAARGRLFDLEKVVRAGYCHPGFQGKTSIKYVLPVVAQDLNYTGLVVGNGEDAAGVFGLMFVGEIPAEEHDAKRRELLTYCGVDTIAMVRVYQALRRLRAEG